jgi:hypothetical protein
MRTAQSRGWIALVAIAALAFVSGCATIPPPRSVWNMAAPAPREGQDRTGFNLSVYDNVWRWIRSGYYDANFNGVDWPAAGERHRAGAAAAPK